MELEPEAEGVGEFGEAVAGAAEEVEVGAGGGDAEGGGRVALGDGLHERGPLDAVHDFEVEDVDGLLAGLYGFEDGLVSREVGEPDEWGDLVE